MRQKARGKRQGVGDGWHLAGQSEEIWKAREDIRARKEAWD